MKRTRLVRKGGEWRRPLEGCHVRQGGGATSGWAGIPNDLLHAVLNLASRECGFDCMLAMRFTCREWYHAHSEAVQEVKLLCVQERDLQPIANLRNLRRLDMPLCLIGSVSSEGFHATLPILTQLTSLALSRMWNGAARRLLPAVGCVEGLAQLQLGGSTCQCNARGDCWEGGEITDAQLRSLASLCSLSSLKIDGIQRLTGSAFQQVAPSWAGSLRTVVMVGCRHLTDAALHGFGCLPNLWSLRIEDCSLNMHGRGGRFTDAGLAHLGQLSHLTELMFVHNGDKIGVSDVGTCALAEGLTALERLDLSWNQNLGDSAAVPLAALTRLSHLDLAYCNAVTEAVWGPLEAMAEHLVTLRLTRRCSDCGAPQTACTAPESDGEYHPNLPGWWCARHGVHYDPYY